MSHVTFQNFYGGESMKINSPNYVLESPGLNVVLHLLQNVDVAIA